MDSSPQTPQDSEIAVLPFRNFQNGTSKHVKKKSREIMSDPFEARMRFTGMLQGLNATTTAAHKAALYALKFKDYDEDFQSCILEQLGRGDMNNQINIIYFLEQLCDVTVEDKEFRGYLNMLRRDISKIVDLAAPHTLAGQLNIRDVKKVLTLLEEKQYLDPPTVSDLSTRLQKRQNTPLPEGQEESIPRRIIEQRIEEDRERHKRIKDAQWITSPDGDDEFEAMYERTAPSLEPSDIEEIKRQAEDRQVREDIVAGFLPDPPTSPLQDEVEDRMDWQANGESNGNRRVDS